MYYKGANILHTIRQIVDNDEKWRAILRGINKDFYHQQVSSKQIEDYIIKNSGKDLSIFFDQYLRTIKIPVFEYKINKKKITYSFTNALDGLNFPVKVYINDKPIWLHPSTKQKTYKFKENIKQVQVDRNFYIETSKN